ncbi:hypothetical protein [Ahrensia sp. R2A130]|uniref:hypothetical protein n=1 Tax=Ahrensia sp. R2A130 TaxID=744979 RepID=UPI0001E0F063|nr:hypothetical protein [Ahrensia sp. R2A130]EFL90413.1 putative signal peptide protein [Ahrensia sp. R2A130]
MRFPFRFATRFAFAAVSLAVASTAAHASDTKYFNTVSGTWAGAGTIVNGPYKNTRFTCRLAGTNEAATSMKLSGKCRVGLFSQPIEATVSKRGKGFQGAFLDGAEGKGLDITSGKRRGGKMLLRIKRKALTGTMVANLKNANLLNITILVDVKGKQVPFIGLTMNREGAPKRASFDLN